MMFRKINSYLALAATAFFIIHAALMCLLLGGAIPYRPWYHIAGRLLLIFLIGHAALSMFIFFMNMEENKNGSLYWKNNKATAAQRMLAILLLFMAFLHMQTGAKLWVFQVIYIAVASGHICLSIPRAMLTAGAVKSEKAYKGLQIFSVVLGIAITVWAAASYAAFAMMGD